MAIVLGRSLPFGGVGVWRLPGLGARQQRGGRGPAALQYVSDRDSAAVAPEKSQPRPARFGAGERLHPRAMPDLVLRDRVLPPLDRDHAGRGPDAERFRELTAGGL